MSDHLTLADQWRAYGDRPPIARWVSRASLVLGVAIATALTAGIVGGAVAMLWWWLG